MARLIDDLRRKYPSLARRARRSALAAARMNCLECMGGSSRDVDACTAPECAMYPHRFGRRIPTGRGIQPSRIDSDGTGGTTGPDDDEGEKSPAAKPVKGWP